MDYLTSYMGNGNISSLFHEFSKSLQFQSFSEKNKCPAEPQIGDVYNFMVTFSDVGQTKKSFAEDELTQNLRGSGKEVRIRRQLRPLV